MKNLDSVHIDIEDNEDVADMFAGCKAGHTVKLSIEATITEHTEDRVSASIDGIESVEKVGEYEDEDEDELDGEEVDTPQEGADEDY
jgi:hypothetical protein